MIRFLSIWALIGCAVPIVVVAVFELRDAIRTERAKRDNATMRRAARRHP